MFKKLLPVILLAGLLFIMISESPAQDQRLREQEVNQFDNVPYESIMDKPGTIISRSMNPDEGYNGYGYWMYYFYDYYAYLGYFYPEYLPLKDMGFEFYWDGIEVEYAIIYPSTVVTFNHEGGSNACYVYEAGYNYYQNDYYIYRPAEGGVGSGSHMALGALVGYWYNYTYNYSANSDYASTVAYRFDGNPGSRILTIEFFDITPYGYYGHDYGAGAYNLQIKLFEGKQTAQIIYYPTEWGCYYGPTQYCANYRYFPYSYTIFFSGRWYNRYSYSDAWILDPKADGTTDFYFFPEGRYYINDPDKGIVSRRYAVGNSSSDYNDWYNPYYDGPTGLPQGRMYMLGTADPQIANVYPSSEDLNDPLIVKSGYAYLWSGTHPDYDHPAILVDRESDMKPVTLTYKIEGPNTPADPLYQLIYEGLDPNTGSTNITPPETGEQYHIQPVNNGDDPGVYYLEKARGRAAAADGSLNLRAGVPGGRYTVTATLTFEDGDIYEYKGFFQIALEKDASVVSVESPKPKDRTKYPFSASRVAVQATSANAGIYAVKSFGITAKVYDEADDEVYMDSVFYQNTTDLLETGEKVQIDQFRDFRPQTVGLYKLKLYIEPNGVRTVDLEDPNLQEYVGDDDPKNNLFPLEGSDHWFVVAHEIEAQADSILAPRGEVYVGRPIRPIAAFSNQGVSDISDVPIYMWIEDSNGNEVYRTEKILQDIPTGRVNFSITTFDNIFIPPAPGTYTICIEVDSPNDPVDENDRYCSTFEVTGALSGIYTIGTQNDGSPRNFSSIIEALRILYLRGVSGPVTFELTDSEYNIGNAFNPAPALPLTSQITGVNEDNTITFKPAQSKMYQRGGVTINLRSASGIGIIIGQDARSEISSAPVNIVTEGSKRYYANSSGYITFDGGSQKALKVTMETESNFRAPFYLGKGARNITIRNVLIEDGINQNPSFTSELPLTKFNTGQRSFVFEDDYEEGQRSFSTGVLIRNQPALYEETDNNFFHLDTLRNSNITVENNEIKGFGYGIVSLGIGVLYLNYDQQGNPVGFTKYYNENNTYANNIISDVSRAGIFLGYEKDSKVSGNRIYGVNGMNSADAAGIILGGDGNERGSGYNNIGIEVTGNEISNVKSEGGIIYGIKVDQFSTSYPDGNRFVYFPDEAEEMTVANNIVWGLSPVGDADAHRAGVHFTTSRDYNVNDEMTRFVTPLDANYWTEGDKVANNTIIISDDGNIENAGITAAIAIQQSENAEIYNNAILFEDMSFSSMSPVTAGIFVQGQFPGENSWMSNRNAFRAGNADAAFYRFIETDSDNNIVEFGSRNEFESLEQWRVWTGQDLNSVVADFSGDYAKVGNAPYSYRIDEDPLPPKGSVLNNRGMRLDYVEEDIDGTVRGAAGQRYDIGAVEFNGRMYINDIEMISLTAPASYRSGDGMFNDAEYIMTEAPVDISALIRNNGTLQQSDIDVYLEIFLEQPTGGYDMDSPVIEDSLKATVSSTESGYVMFNLSDDEGPKFNPMPYSDLPDHTAPDMFSTMTPNVTPKYMVRVRVESDEHNENNAMDKEVRFYLKRSPVSLLVSSENTTRDLDLVMPDEPTADEIAGKLNMDSLLTGMRYIGWLTDERVDRYDVDLFDRGSWEPRSVNYTMYRSMFWSDGDESDMGGTMTRYQRIDIADYLAAGASGEKKNLIMGSQELVRNQTDEMNPYYAPEFISRTLRAVSEAPHTPMGAGVSYDGYTVTGVSVGTDLEETVMSTDYMVEYTDTDGSHTVTDVQPYPALLSISPEGPGFARPAYYYNDYVNDDSTMGIATISQSTNIVFLGVDWRHWGNIERVLRSVLDFVEKNGGVIIPVELADFRAKAVGKSSQLDWETASEYNSARFEIERARINEAGRSEFARIGEVAAAGESATGRDYSYRDFGVDYGQSYSYRLKMVDADGSYEYSSERSVTIGEAEGMLTIGEAMPNPATDEARFNVATGAELELTGQLYDMSGQSVGSVITETVSGTSEIKVDLNGLSSGSYQLVLKSGGAVITRTITVVK